MLYNQTMMLYNVDANLMLLSNCYEQCDEIIKNWYWCEVRCWLFICYR